MADKKQDVNPVQVQKFLGGIDYPCSKQDLIDTAKGQGADKNVISTLEQLPDKNYDSPTDVTKAIGDIE
jgi:hypothetical protein